MTNRARPDVIIQARMTAARLPGKVLLSFMGTTVLEYLADRMRAVRDVRNVIVATTGDDADDAIAAVCARRGYGCFRGSENDVLARYFAAASAFGCHTVIRVTADNPLTDSDEMLRMVSVFHEEHLDYATNHRSGMPEGLGSEVFTFEALARAHHEAGDPYDREHVTSYFYRNPDLFAQKSVRPLRPHPDPSLRLTLDTVEDYERLKSIVMPHELVSIIIRSYNTGTIVARAIESALAQETSVPTEIVVVDDGSTDDTPRQLEPYRDRTRLVSGEHRGHIAALNRGIGEGRGKYFIILDADDVLLPGGIEALYRALLAAPGKGFAYGDYVESDAASAMETQIFTKDRILRTIAGGILFRKDIIMRIGAYDETLVFPEYDVLLKLRKRYPGIHVHVPVYGYMRREGSITRNRERVAKGKRQLEERYGPLPDLRSY